jgi:hypothetical protein
MLLSSIPGKTFSNTVLRGEYDSEAEAVLSLDDLVRILTIWVVDIYHNNPNLGRDDQTPADLWAHETASASCMRTTFQKSLPFTCCAIPPANSGSDGGKKT